jgi:glycosyltransferase involved in cell wall biosynthesis
LTTAISSICRAATRKKGEPLNILTFPTHERYESGLAQTGHNFYGWRGENIKDWNTTYAPIPSNYHLLNGKLPEELDLDLVLSQNKWGQYPTAYYFARNLHLPLITLEHTLPSSTMQSQIAEYKRMRGNINIFISKYSQQCWQWENDKSVRIIHHGVDTNLFKPVDINREIHVLSVVNDFANRDWCCGYELWRQLTAGLPVKLLGDNPGLSKAAGPEELTKAYQSCRVFLNTSLVSPVPTVLLEAMACGAPVVSTNNCMIPEVIQHGVNGFISNNEEELRHYLELLLEDQELGIKLGVAARHTIQTKFSLDSFIKNWQQVFDEARDVVFTGDFNES